MTSSPVASRLPAVSQGESAWSVATSFAHYKTRCTDYILSERVQKNWKGIVMISGIALSVVGVAATLFSGAPFLCGSFLLLGGISAAGTYFMHQYAHLQEIEQTAQDLRATQGQLHTQVETLQGENGRLKVTSQELASTNCALRATSQNLQTRNQELQQSTQALHVVKETLTEQVAKLTLQVTQLTESAERIFKEVERLSKTNGLLEGNVRALNRGAGIIRAEISASQALCTQITQQFATQDQALTDKIKELTQLIGDITEPNSVVNRINELGALRTDYQKNLQEFTTLREQYATENGRLQELVKTVERVRDELRSVSTQLQKQNQGMQDNVTWLSRERELLQPIFEIIRGAVGPKTGIEPRQPASPILPLG